MRGSICLLIMLAGTLAMAQDEPVPENGKRTTAAKTKEALDTTKKKVERVAADIDQSTTAQEASAGILRPIYQLAETLAFPAFHWVAFALMAAGVVSYALQMVLAKLAVLMKGSISLREILSDALGFSVSLIGLVLTTQAATENSTFTQSAAAVLSATVLGVLMGLVLYRWAQKTEVEAAEGRRKLESAQRKR